MNRLDLLEDSRFSTDKARFEYADAIENVVRDWTLQYTVDELFDLLSGAGIACAKVESIDEVVQNPQLIARNKIVVADDPLHGEMPMMALPLDFSDAEFSVYRHAPELGEHTREILKEWIGYTDEQIDELISWGAIQE
jgi:crotonobetainyl-CoA:carnitine CoA-transferase CaiB-like acyl-CoA transferase